MKTSLALALLTTVVCPTAMQAEPLRTIQEEVLRATSELPPDPDNGFGTKTDESPEFYTYSRCAGLMRASHVLTGNPEFQDAEQEFTDASHITLRIEGQRLNSSRNSGLSDAAVDLKYLSDAMKRMLEHTDVYVVYGVGNYSNRGDIVKDRIYQADLDYCKKQLPAALKLIATKDDQLL